MGEKNLAYAITVLGEASPSSEDMILVTSTISTAQADFNSKPYLELTEAEKDLRHPRLYMENVDCLSTVETITHAKTVADHTITQSNLGIQPPFALEQSLFPSE